MSKLWTLSKSFQHNHSGLFLNECALSCLQTVARYRTIWRIAESRAMKPIRRVLSQWDWASPFYLKPLNWGCHTEKLWSGSCSVTWSQAQKDMRTDMRAVLCSCTPGISSAFPCSTPASVTGKVTWSQLLFLYLHFRSQRKMREMPCLYSLVIKLQFIIESKWIVASRL